MNLNSVDQGDVIRSMYNAVGTLHAQVSRNNLLWSRIEPVEGQQDWSRADQMVDRLTSAGVEPLLVLYLSPSWANHASGSADSASQVPTDPVQFAQWVADYAKFAGQAAARYKGRVHLWEIWNEENGRFTWLPHPDPDQYATFYTAVRAAILAQDPSAKVAMGGIGNITAGAPGTIYGLDYLKAVNADGVYPDYVAVHAYPSKGQAPDQHIRYQNNFDDLDVIRRYQQSINWNAPIWLTEWGWSTEDWDTAAPVVSRQDQAKYVYCSLNLLATDYRYVTVATYFLDFDRQTYGYGLFYSDMTPKPAANAFGKFMAAQSGAIGTDPAVLPTIVGAPPPPRVADISSMTISPGRFRVRRAGHGGGLVRFNLTGSGAVRFRIQRPSRGRRVKGRCVQFPRGASSKRRRKANCRTWRSSGPAFIRTGRQGVNRFRYGGRLAGKPLRSGRYRLLAAPVRGARRARARFAIIR